MKNKTGAAWLALLGGPFGLHRFYLHGSRDVVGWALTVPSLLGLYGVWRAREWGLDDLWSWILMPMLGFTVAGCALTAIVYGLMDSQRWNTRFNVGVAREDRSGTTNWLTIGAVIFSLFFGTIALMSSLAFTFQRIFEFQALPGVLGGL